MTDREFFMENVFIGLKEATEEEVAIHDKTEFDGLDKYLYITGMSHGKMVAAKVTNKALDILEVSAEDAWNKAEENTFADTKIYANPAMALAEIGIEAPPSMMNSNMAVVTNTDGFLGAGSLLNKDAIYKCFEDTDVDTVAVLPSSIHEVLLLPIQDPSAEDIKYLTNMVREINENVVEQDDRLTNRVYVMSVRPHRRE